MEGTPGSELWAIAGELRAAAAVVHEAAISEPLSALEDAAIAVARAWSGSSLGFHASVYYANFEPPPPGAHFSSEWGFMGFTQGTTGDWRECRHQDVVDMIRQASGDADTGPALKAGRAAQDVWIRAQAEIVSILTAFLSQRPDDLLGKLNAEADGLRLLSAADVRDAFLPSGQLMSRDSTAITQGLRLAPHQEILTEIIATRAKFEGCETLAGIAERAARHLERLQAGGRMPGQPTSGTTIFIGHGRSLQWRELKDFLQDRLHLQWSEFNRIPPAGVATTARLSKLLDEAGMAFLVMTAEDETADGVEQARQNVVHEAGLFQGRLGFERAVVLLEEGCSEFSNIHGLGQIRYPRGNIASAFEEIRRVLEREGVVRP